MGINIDYSIIKGGYLPKGHGIAKISVNPLEDKIKPLNLTGIKGKIHTIYINVITRNDQLGKFGKKLRVYVKSKLKRLMRKGFVDFSDFVIHFGEEVNKGNI